MTEYVVLIVGDADRWWTSMTLKERQDGYAEYTRFGEELARRGTRSPVAPSSTRAPRPGRSGRGAPW
ncbi:MAG: hypothetical protein ACXVXD_12765 [Nocardioidaceae bacterium]